MNVTQFSEEGAVISIAPDTLLIGWGKREWLKEPASPDIPYFYFPDYFLNDPTPWFTHRETCIMRLTDFIEMFQEETLTKAIEWRPPVWSVYNEAYRSLEKSFDSGRLAKAVLYVFEHARCSVDSLHIKQWLRNALDFLSGHQAHLYGFWGKGQGMLGVTPEILFKLEEGSGKVLETVACAGTSRKIGGIQEFLNDPKERYEHRLVVEGITSSLQSYGTVSLEEQEVQSFGHLSHLITPIKAHLRDEPCFTKLVEALHPTPALGAYPREAGWTWLKGYEKIMPRGRYGAPAGYRLSRGKGAGCLVAIRNVQWETARSGTVISLGAGSGVVPESRLEKEREEIERKICAIKGVFGIE